MKTPVSATMITAALFICACGSKQPEKTAKTEVESDTSAMDTAADAEKNAAVEDAKKQIQSWISEDVAKKFAATGLAHGKVIGDKLAHNDTVIEKIKLLTKNVLEADTVKPRLDEIESKATAGFGKKLTLGWKALKAGGIDAFKGKVGDDAKRVGMNVMAEHIKNDVLKDERAGKLFKAASPVLKIQGKIAAIALQENLSPKVAQQILSIALRIAAASSNSEIASRVERWIATCQSDANDQIDKALAQVSQLASLEKALADLAVEVVEHPRTTQELVQMIGTLLDDPAISEGLVKVYEAAAFEKGDDAIAEAMRSVIALPSFDEAIFATLTRLAEAPGAGDIIGKNLKAVGEDPALAAIVEDFILSILDTCGDPDNV